MTREIRKLARSVRARVGRTSADGQSGPAAWSGLGSPRPDATQRSPDEAEWVQRASAIAPLSAAHADESESLRRLADPLAEAMRDADFGRMMVPLRYGGHQTSLRVAMAVVEELSRQDGSLGWNGWVSVGHGRTADCMKPEAADAVFRQGSVLAGSITPTGRAVRVEGGYRLTGQWAFASACHIADWLIAGATVEASAGRDEEVLAFVMPRGDANVLSTWRVMGLRATGSEDFTVENTFVPEAFTFPAYLVYSVVPAHREPAYGRPYNEYSPVLMAAVAVGVARHAIEVVQVALADRQRRGDPRHARMQAVQFDRLGRAEALVQSSRSWLYEVGDQLDALRPGDPPLSLLSRLASAHAAVQCADAVRMLFDAGGSAPIYVRDPLERCFRDVQIVAHHASINHATFVDAGDDLVAQVGDAGSD